MNEVQVKPKMQEHTEIIKSIKTLSPYYGNVFCEEIKPDQKLSLCQFCGGEAVLIHLCRCDEDYEYPNVALKQLCQLNRVNDEDCEVNYVYCKSCSVETEHYLEAESAINVWEKRDVKKHTKEQKVSNKVDYKLMFNKQLFEIVEPEDPFKCTFCGGNAIIKEREAFPKEDGRNYYVPYNRGIKEPPEDYNLITVYYIQCDKCKKRIYTYASSKDEAMEKWILFNTKLY